MASVTFLDPGNLSPADLTRKLCVLVERLVQEGKSVALLVPEKELEVWSRELWVFKDSAFLPHSVFSGIWPEDEPVTISAVAVPARENSVAVALAPAPFEQLEPFAGIYELVDRSSPDALAASRLRWASWKASSRDSSYSKEW